MIRDSTNHNFLDLSWTGHGHGPTWFVRIVREDMVRNSEH